MIRPFPETMQQAAVLTSTFGQCLASSCDSTAVQMSLASVIWAQSTLLSQAQSALLLLLLLLLLGFADGQSHCVLDESPLP